MYQQGQIKGKNIKIDSVRCPSLPFFEMAEEHFFNKTTVIYGAPRTGKSTIIDNILYILKDHIPNVVAISPTDAANSAYSKRIPAACVHTKLTLELLTNVVKRQEDRMKIYEYVNKMKNLRALFDKIPDGLFKNKRLRFINGVRTKTLGRINAIETSRVMDYPSKQEAIRNVKQTREEIIKMTYKDSIQKFDWSLTSLSKKDKRFIKHLDHNPFMILVIDDCSSQMKNKKFKPILLDMFSLVRHLGLTILLALHNDSNILPELRNIAFVSIFADEENSTMFFGRGAMSPEKKATAKEISRELFKMDVNSSIRNWKKFVYTKENLRTGIDQWSHFHYAHADIHDHFRVGSENLWKLCEESTSQIDDDSIFESLNYNF